MIFRMGTKMTRNSRKQGAIAGLGSRGRRRGWFAILILVLAAGLLRLWVEVADRETISRLAERISWIEDLGVPDHPATTWILAIFIGTYVWTLVVDKKNSGPPVFKKDWLPIFAAAVLPTAVSVLVVVAGTPGFWDWLSVAMSFLIGLQCSRNIAILDEAHKHKKQRISDRVDATLVEQIHGRSRLEYLAAPVIIGAVFIAALK